MADQVSPYPESAKQRVGDYSKEGVLKTLLQGSLSNIRDSREILFLLDTYHVESGEPVRLTDHHSLQIYPICSGSLHPNLHVPTEYRPTDFLYKVTLRYANTNNDANSEDIFQGLVIGRLMKDGKGTQYVVFLTSGYQLYACLSGSLDEHEASPYRVDNIENDDDDDEDDYDYSDFYAHEAWKEKQQARKEEQKFINDKEVFEFPGGSGAPKVVYLGVLEGVLGNRSNTMPRVMGDVKEWECHQYVDGGADKSFENDAQLAHACRDSLSARSTVASGSCGSFGSGSSGGSGSSKATMSSQSTISLPPNDHEKWGVERAGRTWVGYLIHRLKGM